MLGFFLGAPVWGTIGFFLALFVIGATRKEKEIQRKNEKCGINE